MAELSEINFAIKTLIKNGTKKNNITVLHCIYDYPTKIENVNLNFINTLKKISKNVGFSDTNDLQNSICSTTYCFKSKYYRETLHFK